MAWNEHMNALPAAVLAACLLAGCSVGGPRQSPIKAVTDGSPTVVEIYRGEGRVIGGTRSDAPRDALRADSTPRAVAAGDGDTQRYWSAIEPMRQRFARVPNPDLVMVVYPHLAKGQYPVPGYVTVFPMYEQANLYALPGEVERDLSGRHPSGVMPEMQQERRP